MKVFIAGIDGYLGWSLVSYLAARGHEIGGIDNYLRRKGVEEMGSDSAIPICSMQERAAGFEEKFGKELYFQEGDLLDYDLTEKCFKEFQPEAIVHFGEIPSAPFSMVDVHHAVFTQKNNILNTLNMIYAMKAICPDAQLVKLGTMGEYGTPQVPIPEGFLEIEHKGKKVKLPFPKMAGSWYHQSKVHDSNNVQMACRLWGLRSTDIMQGVVYGTRTEEMGDDPRMATRMDYDQSFGTAINRFCAQAVVGMPVTPFGKGGQKRGFLPLQDSMQCVTLAIMNPPEKGEYRVFNQFEEVYNVTDLAMKVQKIGNEFGLNVEVRNMENPRMEMEEHDYEVTHEHLLKLGYKPTSDMEAELRTMFKDLLPNKARIERHKEALTPDIRWSGERKKVDYIK